MLTIRKDQMDALAREGFVMRLRGFLNEAFPQSREVPVEEMKAALRRQLQQCSRYGLVTERQASIYTISAWLLGERFDEEHRAAAEILTSDDDPDLKMQRLEDWTLILLRTLEGR